MDLADTHMFVKAGDTFDGFYDQLDEEDLRDALGAASGLAKVMDESVVQERHARMRLFLYLVLHVCPRRPNVRYGYMLYAAPCVFYRGGVLVSIFARIAHTHAMRSAR